MPTTGQHFITILKQAHLEWGSHRQTNTRGIRYGEGYLQIPASDAYNCEITNDKEPARSQIYNFSTSDGFITNGRLKASGNQAQEKYAKQFHGDGNLQLLGDWFYHIDAQIGDEIEIKFISPADILLTKI